jgi:hypothetical protein
MKWRKPADFSCKSLKINNLLFQTAELGLTSNITAVGAKNMPQFIRKLLQGSYLSYRPLQEIPIGSLHSAVLRIPLKKWVFSASRKIACPRCSP